MSQQAKSFRRIVTGHDAEGKAIIMSDAPPPRAITVGGSGGATFFEVWNTREMPVRIDRESGEPEETGLVLSPPKTGTRIRVIDFPPEGEAMRQLSQADAQASFKAMGGEAASNAKAGSPHPLMHRTETLDYGIVLEGEMTLIVDRGETVIRAGDIVIQRGTSHAWANRSDKRCRMAFILIDGKFTAEFNNHQ